MTVSFVLLRSQSVVNEIYSFLLYGDYRLMFHIVHRYFLMLFLHRIKLADGNACKSSSTTTVTETHEGTENVVFTFTGNNENWVDGGLEYLDCIEAGM